MPETEPTISVVTAAYNPGPDLVDAAKSLTEQGLATEWVIVDDGSAPDHAPHFSSAQDIAASAGIAVTVLTQRNSGQAAARNAGICAARGTFIKCLDADDMLEAGHLAALLAASRTLSGKVVAFAPTRHVYAGSSHSWVNKTYEAAGTTPQSQLALLLDTPFLHHGGALFPKSLLMSLGSYDKTLVTDEDGDLLIRILLEGWTYQAVPGVHYVYRHDTHRPRVSRDDSPAKRAARWQVCQRVLASDDASAKSPQVRRALARRLDRLALSAWLHDKAFSKAALRLAREAASDYRLPGRGVERALRHTIGIGAAVRTMAILRALRPKMV